MKSWARKNAVSQSSIVMFNLQSVMRLQEALPANMLSRIQFCQGAIVHGEMSVRNRRLPFVVVQVTKEETEEEEREYWIDLKNKQKKSNTNKQPLKKQQRKTAAKGNQGNSGCTQ